MIIGITGKSGAGKHTAANFFRQRNWQILDSDEIAHNLYRPYTSVWKMVVDRFGEGVLGKKDLIDRQKLGSIVFDANNKSALEDLNKIMHPEIKRVIKDNIHRYFRRGKNIIVLGALWQAIDMKEYCEKIILIKTKDELSYERLKKRDGINDEIIKIRFQNQLEIPNPDFIIENNGSFQDFYNSLNNIIKI